MITTAQPQVQIDEALKVLLQQQTENCTIVHCTYASDDEAMAVRIWPSTFLVQQDGSRSKLVKAFNISLMPHWTYHESGTARFTLVFEGLSRACTHFQLFEDIPEPGGFYSDNISRNSTDVYKAEVYC